MLYSHSVEIILRSKNFQSVVYLTGIVNLLRRKKLDKIALETGFFIEISSEKKIS